ncbi:MAG TPA: hypothetical protein VMT45_02455 [Thermoanaerobaculaceae bacterium]|nr:hypothetical protein [Thermoanaerobaculaceae bacterium]
MLQQISPVGTGSKGQSTDSMERHSKRVPTYLKSRAGVNLVKHLGLTDVSMPLLAFGTTFSICVTVDGER